jgi:2-hydroxychromene-2-carboxylate isomerase
MDTIDFFFDFRSPYSYLAHSQLGALPATVRHRPIDVLELMKQVNNTPTTVTCPAKRAYAGKDLARWAARYAVPFGAMDMARLDGGFLLRLAMAAGEMNLADDVVGILFKAVWGRQGDASAEGAASLLAAAGLPATELIAAANAGSTAQALADATSAAAALGVFGAPTFRVADDLYFGNDRLDFVREALAAQRETV